MQIPSILQGESLKRLVQGAIAGGAALMIVGSFWPGWVLESTAQKRIAAQEKSILVNTLAPACADKFRNQPDVTAQVAALKDVATWHRDRHMVERNFVVKSGESMTDDAIGAACINLLADLTK
jgi:hypothetical protein